MLLPYILINDYIWRQIENISYELEKDIYI